MGSNRVQELMGAMRSFNKKAYRKNELLAEMFKLQQEMVRLTFNGDHADKSDLRIWDVETHLRQMNAECGGIADEELRRFEEESKVFSSRIKTEYSGSHGEAKAFKALERVKSKNMVLKNIELADGDVRTELDAVVITPAEITIVEVKNTAKGVFIDEKGDFYRLGEFSEWDCDIAGKMKLREKLLRKALAGKNLGNIRIESIVTFTNKNAEIQNQNPDIKICFLSQLPYIIDGVQSEQTLSDEQMHAAKAAIEGAACSEAYPLGFDVQQYKKDYAILMAKLETAALQKSEEGDAAVIDEIPAEKQRTVVAEPRTKAAQIATPTSETQPEAATAVERQPEAAPDVIPIRKTQLGAEMAVERPAEAGLAEIVPVDVKSAGKAAAENRHAGLRLADMAKLLLSSGKAGKTGTTAAAAVIAGTAAATIAIAGAAAAITVAAVRRGQAA